jgi:hypothetical protein
VKQALPSFLNELEKIAMARVGLDPGAHVALRLMERVPGLTRRGALEAERRILQALQKPGGSMKYLGKGAISYGPSWGRVWAYGAALDLSLRHPCLRMSTRY